MFFGGKKLLQSGIIGIVILAAIGLIGISSAQYWQALPPYNTLWPLWSLALSPANPITGLPTPIVSQLTPSTILPVEPGLTWNPALANPWLLYNTPLGMIYFDPLFGLNTWPPSGLLNASGLPIPLTLPSGFASLPPTPFTSLSSSVSLANSAASLYLTWYFNTPGPSPITTYLTAAQLLSLVPLPLTGPSPLISLFAALPIPIT